MQAGRSFRDALEGERIVCRIRIIVYGPAGSGYVRSGKITVQRGIDGAWHSHCNSSLTNEYIAASILRAVEAATGTRWQTLSS